jgi:hypothetical protein
MEMVKIGNVQLKVVPEGKTPEANFEKPETSAPGDGFQLLGGGN